jgi:hypothetical protein
MAQRVVITDQSFPHLDEEQAAARAEGAELIIGDGVLDEDAVADLTAGAPDWPRAPPSSATGSGSRRSTSRPPPAWA